VSVAALAIGTTILEDEKFVASFTAMSRQRLAASYRLATSILDFEDIEYVKGGYASKVSFIFSRRMTAR
jgi:1-aminocyclopropane-1-carboxylate synthase